jgi:acyl carrier protein
MAIAFVRETAARILGLDASTVGPAQDLHGKGLDSLMAVEMRNDLGAAVGETLPATLLYDYPSPTAVAGYLLAGVLRFDPPAPDSPVRSTVKLPPLPAATRQLETLSDDELESLLDSKLAEVLKRRDSL